MSMLADLHTHTSLCKHASGSPEDYLAAAAKAGLSFLGVSDHCPWPEGFDPNWRMNCSQFREYSRLVASLKEKAASTPVKVLYGVEMDWVPGRMDEVWSNLASEPFDYLIGSVHYLDGFPMDDPSAKARWLERGGPDAIWLLYADSLCEFLEEGGFDIIGHLDLPKKFAFYPSTLDPFHARMADALSIAASKGIAIELNTAGLRKEAREIYPSRKLLRMAYEADVKICFGSDAHSPFEVGYAFDKAVAEAKAAGYSSFVRFEGRKPIEEPLP